MNLTEAIREHTGAHPLYWLALAGLLLAVLS